MNQIPEKLLSQISQLGGDTVSIILRPSDGDIDISLSHDPPVIEISGREIPEDWYISIPQSLSNKGIQNIKLSGPAKWLGDDPAPREAVISDHIACHVPSPLTGSGNARFGQAFIDMRGAYTFDANSSSDRYILWHTVSDGEMGDEERAIARSAGCLLASHIIAPWAIGARAAGSTFSAVVIPVT